MTLEQAQSKAKRLAKLTGDCYYVMGPFTSDGYVPLLAKLRVELYPDRAPVFTAAPDGRTSTP